MKHLDEVLKTLKQNNISLNFESRSYLQMKYHIWHMSSWSEKNLHRETKQKILKKLIESKMKKILMFINDIDRS